MKKLTLILLMVFGLAGAINAQTATSSKINSDRMIAIADSIRLDSLPVLSRKDLIELDAVLRKIMVVNEYLIAQKVLQAMNTVAMIRRGKKQP